MDLSVLEQAIMLAVLRKHPNAYGIAIQDEIKERMRKEYSFGSIYASLERLEDQGFVKTRKGEATAVRGGRKKTYFELTGEGRKVLSISLHAMDELREGVMVRGG